MHRFKVYQVIVHIAGWLLFMAFPILFINGDQSGAAFSVLKDPYYWLYCCTYFSLYYLNTYLLIPVFFFKKAYTLYSIIVLLLFIGVYFLQPYDKLLRHSFNNRNAAALHNTLHDNFPEH